MARLINVTTSEARVENRIQGTEITKREKRIASWEDPQPSTPLFPSRRTSRHRNIDVPPTIFLLCLIHIGSTPLSGELTSQNLAQLLPSFFSESSAISLRRILHSKPCPTSWTLGKHILYFHYVTLHWILMKFWGINFLNYIKWRKRIQGKLKIWKSLKD